MSYLKTSVIGISWMGGVQAAIRILTFVKFLIIVKILSATDLGLYTIVVIALGFFDTISDLGVSSFIIHLKKNEAEYFNTAWVISIVRGIIFFGVIVICAYPIAGFFNTPEVLRLIVLASTVPLIKGFVNPEVATFTKNFRFGLEFTFRTSLAIIEVVLSIILVVIFKSVDVLIISLILTAAAEVYLSNKLTIFAPKFIFDKKKALKIITFGKWYTASGIIAFFSQQLDSIIVGRTLGSANLGLYQIAQKFSLQLISSGGDVISKVLFPIYSKLGTSRKRLVKVFFKTFGVVGGVAVLLGLLLFVFSDFFITSVVSKEYADTIINPFRVFIILGVLTVMMSLVTSLYLSRGKHNYTTRLVALRLVLIIFLLGPLSKNYGITGASLASLLSFAVMVPFSIYYLLKTFRYKN